MSLLKSDMSELDRIYCMEQNVGLLRGNMSNN
jgi:hypothetical protein